MNQGFTLDLLILRFFLVSVVCFFHFWSLIFKLCIFLFIFGVVSSKSNISRYAFCSFYSNFLTAYVFVSSPVSVQVIEAVSEFPPYSLTT